MRAKFRRRLEQGQVCGALTKTGGICRAQPLHDGRCDHHIGQPIADVRKMYLAACEDRAPGDLSVEIAAVRERIAALKEDFARGAVTSSEYDDRLIGFMRVIALLTRATDTAAPTSDETHSDLWQICD